MTLKKTYRMASLFTGCGGMDLGAIGGFQFLSKRYKTLPIQPVYAMDIDPSAVAIYNHNFEHECQIADIKKVLSSQIPEHDILTGGFPCQSFSVVAQNPKRLGYKDEKGQLFFEMCRILKEKKPKVFVAENVKGILSANKGEAFPLIIEEFKSSGYHVTYKVLNASHYGVPQKRERVFIVGFRDKKHYDAFSFPEPSTTLSPAILSQVLEPSDEIEENYYFTKRAIAGLKKTKHLNSMNKGRVQSYDQPCNTVGAHLAKVSINSTDPIVQTNGRYRMFTPREVARIQSFPDRFKLPLKKTALYRALGNAVPPVLMWNVTSKVISALESVNVYIEKVNYNNKSVQLELSDCEQVVNF